MRKLRLEGLEGRRLLAGDLASSIPFHNPLIAEDVDYDFNVSPRDALMVINELNNLGSRELDRGPVPAAGKQFIDVNGDGALSPIDALLIVNYLNGEGETSPLVTYTAEITDSTGAPISQVVVGGSFTLTVFVQDTRPTGPTGVFQNAIDVGVSEASLIDFPLDGQSFRDAVDFGPLYQNGRRAFPGPEGNLAEEYFDEVTSFATSSSPPNPTGGVYKFFSVELDALAEGTVVFNLNQHENEPTSQVLVFDASQTLPNNGLINPSMISYGSASLQIITDPTAPTAVPDNVSTPEDTSLLLVGGSVDLTANDLRTEPRTISVVSISTINGTTQGSLQGFTYTPPANFFGTDVLTYTIEDSEGLRSSASITISVSPVNDPPVANDDNLSVDEETSDNVLDVLANDNGGPFETTDTLTIVTVTQPANGGSVTIAADGKSLSYTPDATFIGTETFSYTVRDDGGLTDTATVTVEVEPTILPRARTDRSTVSEDSTNNVIDVLANDRANAGETKFLVGIGTNPANGTVAVDNNNTPNDASDDRILYTPNADFFGTDVFTYTMNDTGADSAESTGTVSITVTDVNDPVALQNDTATGSEDIPVTIAISTLLNNDSPGNGEVGKQTLTLNSVSTPAANGSVAIVGTNVVFTPAANANGTLEFTYTASDNGAPSSSGTATVTVDLAAVNDPPIGVNDTVNATEDIALTIAANTLLANDSPGPANENSQTLTIASVGPTAIAGSTVVLNGTNIVYTPGPNFNGSDSFVYTVRDSLGATATATVAVNVAAVNDAPVAVDDSARAFKDNPLQISVNDLLRNDSPGPADEANQSLTVISVTATDNTNGTVTLGSNGIITYTPAAGYTGPASFTYTVRDSGGGSTDTDSATVNITVEEFVPTIISGTIWMDENNDGAIDVDLDGDGHAEFAELRLGGVEVTLTGVTLGQSIEPLTIMTLSDGSYSFEDLGPGQYVVSFSVPQFMIDGRDVAGPLGDSDAVNNQFTINIAQPGGADASGYNFGLLGIESRRARILDQMASRYSNSNGPNIEGAFFTLGSDNSLKWGSLLSGFDGVQFAEAVLSENGSELVMTIVDSDHQVFSTVLDSTEFVKLVDASGDVLVRVLGGMDDFEWQLVSLATPPDVSAANYLEAIDDIFEQEDWGF